MAAHTRTIWNSKKVSSAEKTVHVIKLTQNNSRAEIPRKKVGHGGGEGLIKDFSFTFPSSG
jgi:hypothetical protein